MDELRNLRITRLSSINNQLLQRDESIISISKRRKGILTF